MKRLIGLGRGYVPRFKHCPSATSGLQKTLPRYKLFNFIFKFSAPTHHVRYLCAADPTPHAGQKEQHFRVFDQDCTSGYPIGKACVNQPQSFLSISTSDKICLGMCSHQQVSRWLLTTFHLAARNPHLSPNRFGGDSKRIRCRGSFYLWAPGISPLSLPG